MPTITREKALKNQALAPEGWSYDWKHYVTWGEHQIFRNIPLADGSIIRGTVSWREGVTVHHNDYGCTWRTPSGTYHPELRVMHWTQTRPGSDMWSSTGLGKGEILSRDEVTRRVYKDLCKYAAQVTDDQILGLMKNGADLQIAM